MYLIWLCTIEKQLLVIVHAQPTTESTMTTKLGELSKILIQTNTVVNTMFNDMLEKVRELEHAIGVSTRDTRGFSSDLTRCLCDGVDDELRNIRALATRVRVRLVTLTLQYETSEHATDRHWYVGWQTHALTITMVSFL